MKRIDTFSETISVNKTKYEVIAMHIGHSYEIFIAPSDGSYAPEFCYGLDDAGMTAEIAVKNGIANAPEYIEMLLEDEWSI